MTITVALQAPCALVVPLHRKGGLEPPVGKMAAVELQKPCAMAAGLQITCLWPRAAEAEPARAARIMAVYCILIVVSWTL